MVFTGRLHPYQVEDVEKMKERKRLLVGYGQGCLTGDTLVTVNRCGKGFTIRLDELVKRWVDGAEGRWPGSRHAPYSDGKTFVRSLLADGTIGRAQLVGVQDTGNRDVYRLALSDGSSIKATAGHEIVTPGGKVPLRDLAPGAGVITDSLNKRRPYPAGPTGGWTLPDGRRTDRRGYVRLYGTQHARRAADGGVFEHHLVVEKMLGRWITNEEEVHHKNGVRHDNRPENLQVLTRQEHLALHNFRPNLAGVSPYVESVVSVEYVGMERVYDLSVADDAHTWVGNGVVVGNTGKTVMTIAAIESLFDAEQVVEPGLVVALASLTYQWQESIWRFTCTDCCGSLASGPQPDGSTHTHTPTSQALVINGTPDKRVKQYETAWENDYVILGYDQVVNDWSYVKDLSRGFMVCDEASFLRGFGARRSKVIKMMDSQYKFGLTGTPIENGKPEEVFSIMEWVDPTVLGPSRQFDQTFIVRNVQGRVVRYRNIPLFLKTLGPAMVRRVATDPDVAPFMPTVKSPEPMLIRFDGPSRTAYNAIAAELILDLEQAASQLGGNFSLDAHYGGWGNTGDKADALRGKIGQKILALQLLCDHPELLRISARKYDTTNGKHGSSYASSVFARGWLDDCVRAPKVEQFIARLTEIMHADAISKVVLFTVYLDMVDLIGAQLPCEWRAFTGKQTPKKRQANKVDFQTDPAVRVLVSSDAGGYGVDLPQANWLFNLDLPDKAGTADQRDTRIVRASSQFDEVTIQPVLVAGSLEERKYLLLQQKKSVASAFLDGRKINKRGGVDMDVKSLLSFLQSNSV